MQSSDQDFKSFYRTFTQSATSQDSKKKKEEIMKQQNFDTIMKDGRAKKVVDWEKVFYSAMGVALLLKGLYFWKK